jgi:hypothetical protein
VRAFEGRPSALPQILALRKDSARLVRPDAMLIGLGLGTPITEGRSASTTSTDRITVTAYAATRRGSSSTAA